jgi:hypothetical protein
VLYRIATEADYPAILQFIEATDYFDPPPHYGGHWVIAESEGAIRACIWFFAEPPYAYVDYWAGKGVAAGAVAMIAEGVMRGLGVRRATGVIQTGNAASLITMMKRLRPSSDGQTYYLFTKDFDHGKTESRADNDCTVQGHVGE